MFDHIGLQVKDLDASVRFWKAALAPLGHVLASHDDASAGLGPEGAPVLWLYATDGAKQSGTHVAVQAKDRKAVDRFHAAGLDAGGKDNGKPGIRKDYAPDYYAAFLIDPDGNNVEAVFMG
ncbi:MAG TPA: VOC family protein [Nannocystaceae bacterium]|nr:VOC family protein [Nannocystaceae bacterium]